jgi:hypothetical protein
MGLSKKSMHVIASIASRDKPRDRGDHLDLMEIAAPRFAGLAMTQFIIIGLF